MNSLKTPGFVESAALCLAGRQVDRRGRLWATQQPVEDAALPVAGRLASPSPTRRFILKYRHFGRMAVNGLGPCVFSRSILNAACYLAMRIERSIIPKLAELYFHSTFR